MANFYAYNEQTVTGGFDDNSGEYTYHECQLHQFAGKSQRDKWVSAQKNAKAVKASDIPAYRMALFMEYGKAQRPDGGFWSVVDSCAN